MQNKTLRAALSLLLLIAFGRSQAQTTAMDFNKNDCNDNPVHLFSDLDSNKAVILFYFMPGCGSCPPVAKKVQAMANNINAMHPGMVKGYAFPFNNTSDCAYNKNWVTSNNLSFYAPMDSGAASVAHYGGFGMPSVVLLGGSDHRVMFFTKSFTTSDTTIMRDSILALMGTTGINSSPTGIVEQVNIYPNPAKDNITISLNINKPGSLSIEVINIMGQRLATITRDKLISGSIKRSFNTATLANGTYFIKIRVNDNVINEKINVLH